MNKPTAEEVLELARVEYDGTREGSLCGDALHWADGYSAALNSPYVAYLEKRYKMLTVLENGGKLEEFEVNGESFLAMYCPYSFNRLKLAP